MKLSKGQSQPEIVAAAFLISEAWFWVDRFNTGFWSVTQVPSVAPSVAPSLRPRPLRAEQPLHSALPALAGSFGGNRNFHPGRSALLVARDQGYQARRKRKDTDRFGVRPSVDPLLHVFSVRTLLDLCCVCLFGDSFFSQ